MILYVDLYIGNQIRVIYICARINWKPDMYLCIGWQYGTIEGKRENEGEEEYSGIKREERPTVERERRKNGYRQ